MWFFGWIFLSLGKLIGWIRLPIAHVWFFGRICLSLSTSVGAIRLPIAHVVRWLDLFESQYIGWSDSAPDCSSGSLAGFV